MKMAPSSGKRMACAPHCFSLPTGCTRLLWPRLKAHLPASSPPPSRFSRLYTIPCRYSPWHTGLALLLGLQSTAAGAYPKSQRSPAGIPSRFWKLLYGWFSSIAGCVPSCLFICRPLVAGDIPINDPGCSPLLNRQRETPSGVGCPGGATPLYPACVFCVAAWTVAPSAGPQHHAGQTDAPQ